MLLWTFIPLTFYFDFISIYMWIKILYTYLGLTGPQLLMKNNLWWSYLLSVCCMRGVACGRLIPCIVMIIFTICVLYERCCMWSSYSMYLMYLNFEDISYYWMSFHMWSFLHWCYGSNYYLLYWYLYLEFFMCLSMSLWGGCMMLERDMASLWCCHLINPTLAGMSQFASW